MKLDGPEIRNASAEEIPPNATPFSLNCDVSIVGECSQRKGLLRWENTATATPITSLLKCGRLISTGDSFQKPTPFPYTSATTYVSGLPNTPEVDSAFLWNGVLHFAVNFIDPVNGAWRRYAVVLPNLATGVWTLVEYMEPGTNYCSPSNRIYACWQYGNDLFACISGGANHAGVFRRNAATGLWTLENANFGAGNVVNARGLTLWRGLVACWYDGGATHHVATWNGAAWADADTGANATFSTQSNSIVVNNDLWGTGGAAEANNVWSWNGTVATDRGLPPPLAAGHVTRLLNDNGVVRAWKYRLIGFTYYVGFSHWVSGTTWQDDELVSGGLAEADCRLLYKSPSLLGVFIGTVPSTGNMDFTWWNNGVFYRLVTGAQATYSNAGYQAAEYEDWLFTGFKFATYIG